MVTQEKITALLATVHDPEIPALSIAEMGILRNVEVDEEGVTVTIAPTYSGCPALSVIENDIVETLTAAGVRNVRVSTSYAHAWTTEWISREGREKLRGAGIVPPQPIDIELPVECPFCGSRNTSMVSSFGSTACKSYYTCQECTSVFEYFKPL
jgi:ring-1,2-phenylacetyl-CoA epoxidase subunit PaaD